MTDTTVWYIGEAFQRVVTSEDWASKGITSADTFWGPANGWAVPQNSLTEDQLVVLSGDPEFVADQDGPRTLQRPSGPISNALLNSFEYYNATLAVYEAFESQVAAAIEDWQSRLQIGDVGQDVVAADTKAEARAAIDAGTSSLELGTTPGTALEGDYQPSVDDLLQSGAVGREIVKAVTADDFWTAIGGFPGDLFNWRTDNTRRIQRSLGKALAGLSANHVVVGDSISQSYTGSQTYTQVWPYLMRQFLSSRGIPLAGTGWVVTGNASSYAKDPRLTLAGTWSDTNGSVASSEAGATLTFTSDLPGTTVEIAYPTTGGAFTVSIDGAAATTVTPAGGALAVAKATFSGLTDTTHTVLITRSSGTVVIYAVKCARFSGLQIHNMSCIGMTAQNWASDATTPRITGWVTRRIGVLSTADVMHITIGVNDMHYSRTPAQVVADVATIAAQAPNADIVLHAEIAPNPANTGTPTTVSSETWNEYVTRLKVLALQLDCPMVNMHQWSGGSYAAALANGLMADGYHPTKTAHGWWGLLVANAIAGKV